MERRITISSRPVKLQARLLDTPTADAIWKALPLSAPANTWGQEIYFAIPVQAGLDQTAAEVLSIGDLGYWPSGAAFCIFFGPTPISCRGEIRAAGPVNIFGRVEGDCAALKGIAAGSRVLVSRAD